MYLRYGKTLEKSKSVTFNLTYAILWYPKYRRKVLINEIDERLEVLLNEKVADCRCNYSTYGSNDQSRSFIY